MKSRGRPSRGSERARSIRDAPASAAAWFSLAAAPIVLVLLFTLLLMLPATRQATLQYVHADPAVRELYAVEIATFWIALLAGVVGLWLCIGRDMAPLERAFFVAFSAGMALVAMEEGAWGQVLFSYETPEWMDEVNRQGEMTLHNIGPMQGSSELFRLAFGIGGLVGLLAPMRWIDRVRVPRSLASALVVITVYAGFDTIGDFSALPGRVEFYFARMSEVVEMLIACTGLAYLGLHLWCRLSWRAMAAAQPYR